MDTMAIRQAFETMVEFIKQFQERGPFEDTGSLLHDLITYIENFLGIGPFGEECYARLLSDGRQLWAEVYHGKLTCAGIRQTPVVFEDGTGLTTPQHP
jgi:hypothetical protein